MRAQPDTLVIGLGNPILGDDGVGWQVATQVAACLTASNTAPTAATDLGYGPIDCGAAAVDCLAVGGLSLMEHLVDFRRAIIIDAIQTGQPNGAVQVLLLSDLPNRALGHLGSSHDTTLHTALDAGRRLGISLPEEIIIIGIEAENVYEFSERLSPAVAAAVPKAVDCVLQNL